MNYETTLASANARASLIAWRALVLALGQQPAINGALLSANLRAALAEATDRAGEPALENVLQALLQQVPVVEDPDQSPHSTA